MASSVKTPAGPALVKDDAPKSKTTKLTKILPSDRVTFAKQLEILRGYAAASAQGTKAVTNVELASIIGMAAETISTCNAFFSSVGFIQKGDGGWTVSQEVQAFFRALDWNKETASHKLAPLVEGSWFGRALLQKISFRALEEEDAVSILADLATAGPEYKRALRILIDFLESVGLIHRDGTQLKARAMPTKSEPQSPPQDATSKSSDLSGDAAPARPRVLTAFSQMAQGAMRFNVSFDVDMAEMANWRPERIAAFFNGIAQVLAAKAEVEKTAGN